MKIQKLSVVFFFLSVTPPLHAVTPMEYYNSLVAGDDDPGFQDGAFDDARFNQPCGLALDEAGKRLFVADKNNNRIRVIYLEEKNRVDTLAGNGDNKNLDGSLDKASFSSPCLLARLPDDQLAVYESGDGSVRIVDLKNKSVSTIAKGLNDVWNLVYSSVDQGLYISMPNAGLLQRIDLKNKTLTRLLANDPQVPRPRALGVLSNKLYLSDGKSSVLYQVEPVFNSLNAAVTVHLDKAGSGDGILQLTASGENLYALQGGQTCIAKILPEYQPVTLASAWGFTLKPNSPYYSPIITNSSDQIFGFTAMPGDQKKFFISRNYSGYNFILSVKDYNFGAHWAERAPSSDFEYPKKKPAKTFRILIVGNSRVVTAPVVPFDDVGNEIVYPPVAGQGDDPLTHHDGLSPRSNIFAKKLELLLNSEAALDDVSEHFEVLTWGVPAGKVQWFAPDEVPPMVEDFDIDLVLVLFTADDNEQYDNYYLFPLTKEGIPSEGPDDYRDTRLKQMGLEVVPFKPEYLLTPWKQRVPDGAPKRLLDACFKDKLTKEVSPTQLDFGSFEDLLYSGDSEIWNDLVEIIGKPFEVLNQRMGKWQTSSGKAPNWIYFYVPAVDCEHCSQFETFWSDVCKRYGLSFLDLTKPFNDLKIGYYPAFEACCHNHYTAYGSELIATILKHDLISQGLVPFTEEKK
jgi:hypothetical protein